MGGVSVSSRRRGETFGVRESRGERRRGGRDRKSDARRDRGSPAPRARRISRVRAGVDARTRAEVRAARPRRARSSSGRGARARARARRPRRGGARRRRRARRLFPNPDARETPDRRWVRAPGERARGREATGRRRGSIARSREARTMATPRLRRVSRGRRGRARRGVKRVPRSDDGWPETAGGGVCKPACARKNRRVLRAPLLFARKPTAADAPTRRRSPPRRRLREACWSTAVRLGAGGLAREHTASRVASHPGRGSSASVGPFSRLVASKALGRGQRRARRGVSSCPRNRRAAARRARRRSR